jgi:hypothetical protein
MKFTGSGATTGSDVVSVVVFVVVVVVEVVLLSDLFFLSSYEKLRGN